MIVKNPIVHKLNYSPHFNLGGTMNIYNRKVVLSALLDLLENAETPFNTIKTVTKEQFHFISETKLIQISESLSISIFQQFPILNNSKRGLELQTFLNWEKDYLRLTKRLHDYYKPLVLGLYLQEIHDFSFKLSREAEREFEGLENELMIIDYLQSQKSFSPESKEELTLLKNILLTARSNYCLAIQALNEESRKIHSMIKGMNLEVKHSMKGFRELKVFFQKSEIISPKVKLEVLNFMKHNFPRMKTMKIEFTSIMDKQEYWMRAVNIQLNKNLLLRIFSLTSIELKHQSLKPNFLKNYFIPIFHKQSPKRLLNSLSDEIQAAYKRLPSI